MHAPPAHLGPHCQSPHGTLSTLTVSACRGPGPIDTVLVVYLAAIQFLANNQTRLRSLTTVCVTLNRGNTLHVKFKWIMPRYTNSNHNYIRFTCWNNLDMVHVVYVQRWLIYQCILWCTLLQSLASQSKFSHDSIKQSCTAAGFVVALQCVSSTGLPSCETQ